MIKWGNFLSGTFCSLALFVQAVDANDSPYGDVDKQLSAVRVKTAPIIDGIISPGEWRESASIDDFHQSSPLEHGRPSQKTVVRVAYDDNFLYIVAEMFDDEPEKILATQKMQGGNTFSDDNFKIYLSPFNNNRSGYFFKVNPNDVRSEALFSPGTRMGVDMNWRGIWYAKAGRTEKGWVAEVAIPHKSLNFDKNKDTWGISFGRDIGRNRERISWTSYNGRTQADSLGELVGIEGIKQGIGLDIKAEMTVGHKKDYGTNESDFEFRPSVDIFYKITPSLTAVLTANTDFSAVDVDDQVVDLTRFSVFLPEKRDFFLQDADIFRFGNIYRNGTPFFSRRIGLDEDSAPIDLKLGLKLTGRIGNWNIGALDVVQERGDHQGDANLFVGRVSYNLLDDSSVGMLMTYGDPITGEGSYVVGADVNLKSKALISGKQSAFSAWIQKSSVDGLVGDDMAFGGKIAFDGNEGLSATFNFLHIEENFDPALGFVNRDNINDYYLSLDYAYRPEGSWVREVSTEIEASDIYTIGGGLESRDIEWDVLKIEADSGDRFSGTVKYSREVLESSYEIVDGVVILPGLYDFTSGSIQVSSAYQRKISARLKFRKGNFYGGTRSTVEGALRYRMSNSIRFNTSYTQHNVKLPVGDFITKLYSVGSDIAFSTDWSWITRIQYDNISKSGGVNSRIRYNPRPGKDLYLVLNHGFFVDEDGKRHSSNSDIIAKLGYTFRF